jgi:hypothetical protein
MNEYAQAKTVSQNIYRMGLRSQEITARADAIRSLSGR